MTQLNWFYLKLSRQLVSKSFFARTRRLIGRFKKWFRWGQCGHWAAGNKASPNQAIRQHSESIRKMLDARQLLMKTRHGGAWGLRRTVRRGRRPSEGGGDLCEGGQSSTRVDVIGDIGVANGFVSESLGKERNRFLASFKSSAWEIWGGSVHQIRVLREVDLYSRSLRSCTKFEVMMGWSFSRQQEATRGTSRGRIQFSTRASTHHPRDLAEQLEHFWKEIFR